MMYGSRCTPTIVLIVTYFVYFAAYVIQTSFQSSMTNYWDSPIRISDLIVPSPILENVSSVSPGKEVISFGKSSSIGDAIPDSNPLSPIASDSLRPSNRDAAVDRHVRDDMEDVEAEENRERHDISSVIHPNHGIPLTNHSLSVYMSTWSQDGAKRWNISTHNSISEKCRRVVDKRQCIDESLIHIVNQYPDNDFIRVNNNITQWSEGNELIRREVDQYLRNRTRLLQEQSRLLIYVKEGTTGIAGQLQGMCNSFWLSFIHGRALQIYSSILSPEFFDSPLESMHYESLFAKRSDNSMDYGYNPSSKLKNFKTFKLKPTFLDKKQLSSFNRTLSVSSSPIVVTGMHFLLNRMERFYPDEFQRMGIGKNDAYRICLRELLVPGHLLRDLLGAIFCVIGDLFTVGVHVRTGSCGGFVKDSFCFVRESQYEYYIRRTREAISDRKEFFVYLSTDSKAVEQTFVREFGDQVIFASSFESGHVGGIEGTRVSRNSVLNAILNLYVLSQCDVFIGTFVSGFSKAAQCLRRETVSFMW